MNLGFIKRLRMILTPKILLQRFFAVVTHPLFLWLMLLLNGCVIVSALLFYSAEHGTNDNLHTLFDAFYWAITSITTVGYGDITPVTPLGKLYAIGLMMVGTLFLTLFSALFTAAILSPDMERFAREIKDVEQDVSDIEEELRTEIKKEEELEKQILAALRQILRQQQGK